MKSIKLQARELQHALMHVLRGTAFGVQIYRAPDGTRFNICATLYREPINNGGPIAILDDLTLDNVPYILAKLSEHTQRRIYFTVYVKARPNKPTIYFIEVPYASGSRRIGAQLADALHASAVRDDDITIVHSRRTDEVSFCEYREFYLYETLEA